MDPRGRLSARTHVVSPETGEWENSNRLTDDRTSTQCQGVNTQARVAESVSNLGVTKVPATEFNQR